MKLFGKRERGTSLGVGCNRGMKMGQPSVSGELGLAAVPWHESVLTELVGDGVHHQLVFSPVLV
jgi:hypothetical protein